MSGDACLHLKRVYADVEPFKLTQGSKVELIQRLMVAVEQRKVSWQWGQWAVGRESRRGNCKLFTAN